MGNKQTVLSEDILEYYVVRNSWTIKNFTSNFHDAFYFEGNDFFKQTRDPPCLEKILRDIESFSNRWQPDLHRPDIHDGFLHGPFEQVP